MSSNECHLVPMPAFMRAIFIREFDKSRTSYKVKEQVFIHLFYPCSLF